MPLPSQLQQLLESNMRNSSKQLGLYIIISIVFLALFIYCIVNMASIISFYYTQKRSYQESSSKRKSRRNNPNDPADDDEVYIDVNDRIAENNDEYKRYTSQINKSIAEFKEYNEKLKTFYKENKPSEEPKDIIDKSIITADNDNYY
jgi:hypothetical protein